MLNGHWWFLDDCFGRVCGSFANSDVAKNFLRFQSWHVFFLILNVQFNMDIYQLQFISILVAFYEFLWQFLRVLLCTIYVISKFHGLRKLFMSHCFFLSTIQMNIQQKHKANKWKWTIAKVTGCLIVLLSSADGISNILSSSSSSPTTNAVASHIKSWQEQSAKGKSESEQVFGDLGLRRSIKAHQSATSKTQVNWRTRREHSHSRSRRRDEFSRSWIGGENRRVKRQRTNFGMRFACWRQRRRRQSTRRFKNAYFVYFTIT